MNQKIRDIKKKHPQHVPVEQESSTETHIDVHNTIQKKRMNDTVTDTARSDTPSDNTTENPTTTTSQNTVVSDADANTPTQEEHAPKEVSVVFMGTGSFAATILQGVYKRPYARVAGIVTQPDKKIGRKKSSINRTLAPNPVRDIAQEKDATLFQPAKMDADAIAQIRAMRPDVIVVASYGKILPKELLEMPEFGAINIHTSLLPQLRGASPAQNALLLGLKETGVTIMQMDEGLDTGDILAQKSTPIKEHEKADELLDRLSHIALELMAEISPRLFTGDITPQPQDHSQATLCQLIDREDGHIQWTQTTQEIYNRYRALYPWPGIFSLWEAQENQMMRLKLRSVYPYDNTLLTDAEKELQPGTVFVGHDQLCVKTFDGALIIEALQPECKAVMPIYDFLNGHKSFEGSVLR